MRIAQSITAAFIATLALAVSAHAQTDLGGRELVTGAVTPDIMTARIEAAAQDLRRQHPDAVADRYAEVDWAWPANEDTGGYAVMLIVAVSKNEAELPLRRVYIRSADGRETDLLRVFSVRTPIAADSVTSSMFGAFREDRFYWAPIDLLLSDGAVMLDFAINRTGFRVKALPAQAPPDWETTPRGEPDVDALNVMLDREYPGFARPAPN